MGYNNDPFLWDVMVPVFDDSVKTMLMSSHST